MKELINPSELEVYDCRGIPIRVGDVIKVLTYRVRTLMSNDRVRHRNSYAYRYVLSRSSGKGLSLLDSFSISYLPSDPLRLKELKNQFILPIDGGVRRDMEIVQGFGFLKRISLNERRAILKRDAYRFYGNCEQEKQNTA